MDRACFHYTSLASCQLPSQHLPGIASPRIRPGIALTLSACRRFADASLEEFLPYNCGSWYRPGEGAQPSASTPAGRAPCPLRPCCVVLLTALLLRCSCALLRATRRFQLSGSAVCSDNRPVSFRGNMKARRVPDTIPERASFRIIAGSASAGEARGLSAAAPRLYNITLSSVQQADTNRHRPTDTDTNRQLRIYEKL